MEKKEFKKILLVLINKLIENCVSQDEIHRIVGEINGKYVELSKQGKNEQIKEIIDSYLEKEKENE